MYDQPRYEDYEPSVFFEDSMSVRPLPTGSIARGWGGNRDPHFYYGIVNDSFVTTFPFRITERVLKRGQERYNIYCSPCHGYAGYGNGIIPQRGFSRLPPSFHNERLRDAPPGYFYNVISEGFGIMYGYSNRIQPADRWAIVAYVQALQRSQHAAFEDIPPDLNELLEVRPLEPSPEEPLFPEEEEAPPAEERPLPAEPSADEEFPLLDESPEED